MDLNVNYLLEVLKQKYAESQNELILQIAINKQLMDKIKELEEDKEN